MSSLVFRAVAGVVNGAACAVNHLLETMYPRDLYVPAFSVASGGPAPTAHAPSGVVADPAEGASPVPSAGSLTWSGWAVPAILEVLAEHRFYAQDADGPHRYTYHCQNPFEVVERHREFESRGYAGALEEWHEHIAPLIAERIGCNPTRAALALTSLQSQ
jgi:hypothetical protein